MNTSKSTNESLGIIVKEILKRVGTYYKLNMSEEDFVKAVMLISTSNCCKAEFIVPVKDNYIHTYDILILESNGAILDTLFKEGYSMSMTPKGLSVTKF